MAPTRLARPHEWRLARSSSSLSSAVRQHRARLMPLPLGAKRRKLSTCPSWVHPIAVRWHHSVRAATGGETRCPPPMALSPLLGRDATAPVRSGRWTGCWVSPPLKCHSERSEESVGTSRDRFPFRAALASPAVGSSTPAAKGPSLPERTGSATMYMPTT